MTWGEQTDVPESADWYNAGLPDDLGLQRAADPHAGRAFLHRGPLQGHQERRRFLPTMPRRQNSPISGCIPKQGTDAALAMAMGHVILREFHLDRSVPYFQDYVRRYTDLPMLVRLVRKGDALRAGAPAARRGFRRRAGRGEQCRVEDDRVRRATGNPVVPLGSVGFRWGEQGQVEPGGQGKRPARTSRSG